MKKKKNQPEAPPVEEVSPATAADGDAAGDTANSWSAEAAEAASAAGDEPGKLQAELDATREKLLYLQADYQNYRRRVAKDLAEARMLGTEATLEPFLRIYDFLALARDSAEKSDNIAAIRQGVAMIISEYGKAFDDLNVRRIDSVGHAFDPKNQEAVAHENSDTVPEGVVIREWAGGYMLGERLLRAAKVVVSAGPAAAEKPAED